MNNYILEMDSIVKNYKNKTALNNVTFGLEKGKIVGLLGPNGSGKTTLLKLANGLIRPTSGFVFVNGKAPGLESKSMISYLPERSYLNEWMKIKDILRFFEDFYEDFNVDKALKMMDVLGLDLNDSLKTLSKGNKEKVQLALVMSREASLYLLDEPIGGVDPASRDFIIETILSNYNPEATLVISTHLISDIEKIFDEVILINNGVIYRHDSVDHIREETGQSIDELFREVFRNAR